MTLEELRNSTDEFQKGILKEMSDSYFPAKKGILTRVLHSKFGKPRVVTALNSLGGSIVREVEDRESASTRYEPTFLGLLVGPNGDKYEALLVPFLEHLESIFRDHPAQIFVTSKDLEKKYGLTRERSDLLYELVMMGDVWNGSASFSPAEPSWQVGVFARVDDLPSWPSKRDFLHHHAMKNYNAKAPVLIAERSGRLGEAIPQEIETTLSQTLAPAVSRQYVFISYSHKDSRFLNQLLAHIKPLERVGLVSKWSDRQIVPGSQWYEEIQSALGRSKIAIMMVSSDFLASDFIHEHELGPLLKEAEKGGVKILWIPVRACAYKLTPLKNYQAVIPPDRPIAEMKAERDAAWVKVCEHITNALD